MNWLLSDLPVTWDDRRINRVVALILVGCLCSGPVVVGAILLLYGYFVDGGEWLLGGLVVGLGLFKLCTLGTVSTVTIDSQGVHAIAEGTSRQWLWTDIKRAKLIHLRDASRTGSGRSVPRIQIQRRGAFYDGDQDNTDLLPVTSAPYGRVIDIVAAGVEQWGKPTPSDADQ